MKWHWWLSPGVGVMGVLLLSLPVEAAQLRFWQFNRQQNQLIFRTVGDVQPRAEFIQNPPRLIIDLPGTSLGSIPRYQVVGDGVRAVRVSQFDAQTTRIVIDLTSGYTLDPAAVQFRGITGSNWVVQLPRPIREPNGNGGAIAPAQPTPTPTPGMTQVDSIRATSSGLFIRTSGPAPQVTLNRHRRRNEIYVDLSNSVISPQLQERERTVNLRGIQQLQIAPLEGDPSVTRITLVLDGSSPNWRASVSPYGGVVVVPTGALAISTDDRPTSSPASSTEAEQPSGEIARIQSIRFSSNEGTLLIEADRPIRFRSSWDRQGNFRLTIPSAQLAEQVRGPDLRSDSPLQEVRLRQEEDNTVVILVQPSDGVRLEDVNQPSSRQLALSLDRTQFDAAQRWQDDIPLGRVREGRVRVVIDPGHGGRDPGAIGMANLREKDIVLSVALQVAELLQQQGVQVVMTRTDDRSVELEDRVRMAERAEGDLFVSIHANAISLRRSDVNGLETYFYSPRGERFARTVHYNLVQLMGMQDRGVRQARFYVLRHTSMPAILVELGFVTGAQDARILANARARRRFAVAIARGILQYIQQPYSSFYNPE